MDVAEFYNKQCDKSNKSWEAAHWNSRDSQQANFDLLLKIAPIRPKETALDVGCGQGDFYQNCFLKQITYEGIDISTKMIYGAKRRFPKANFRVSDLKDVTGSWDWVFASGTFNHMGQDIHEAIRKMYSVAKKGIGLVILSKYDPLGVTMPCDYLQCHDPVKVLETAFSLTRFVNMNHSALDWGFVLFMYKPEYVIGDSACPVEFPQG
jgi:ubiquinone/menaquinone biosynthesis C-methylase UbiE